MVKDLRRSMHELLRTLDLREIHVEMTSSQHSHISKCDSYLLGRNRWLMQLLSSKTMFIWRKEIVLIISQTGMEGISYIPVAKPLSFLTDHLFLELSDQLFLIVHDEPWNMTRRYCPNMPMFSLRYSILLMCMWT